MITTGIVGLLLTILLLVLIVYIALWLISQIGAPEPIGLILRAIVVVIALVFLAHRMGVA